MEMKSVTYENDEQRDGVQAVCAALKRAKNPGIGRERGVKVERVYKDVSGRIFVLLPKGRWYCCNRDKGSVFYWGTAATPEALQHYGDRHFTGGLRPLVAMGLLSAEDVSRFFSWMLFREAERKKRREELELEEMREAAATRGYKLVKIAAQS